MVKTVKLWIMHNTEFGNGKRVAETLGATIGKKMDVKIEHLDKVTPEEVVRDSPTMIIVGAKVRTFMLSSNALSWIRELKKQLKKQKKEIQYGAVFLTHALSKNLVNALWGKRYVRKFKRNSGVEKVFPEWLSGRVVGPEGPLEEGAIEEITAKGNEILEWMK